MPDVDTCPSLYLLQRSLDSEDPMSETERREIESHVERCQRLCKQVVAALLRGSTMPAPTPPAVSAPRNFPAKVEPEPIQLGRYQIFGRIGSGGMGVVYRGHDPHLFRDVAIKVPVFRGSESIRAEAEFRFLREARSAAAIHHPGVCAIYDVGEAEGCPYVVMALIEGESLAERLRRGRYENVAAAVDLVVSVADALGAVHASHIIHRDVKPGNILLDRSGRPYLTDFGLAHAEGAERLTANGGLLGTPGYLAPEQVVAELGGIGPWSDQYSLGVVLYQMLTGRLPFEGPVATQIWTLGSRVAPQPSQFRPDLDRGLEMVLMRALSRRPQDRYSSVPHFADTLRDWQAGATVAHRQPSEETMQTAAENAKPPLGRPFAADPILRDSEAHDLYVRARHFWSKRTEVGFRKSIELFNLALDRDPKFAVAWAGLADAYHQLGHWGLAPPNVAYPRGKRAAIKAIELDDSLVEAHLALAVIRKDYDWNFTAAELEFREVLRQQPDHASGHQWYGQCLACMGRHSEAIAELQLAQELDPLDLINDAVLGRHGYFFARQYEAARSQLEKTVQTDPQFWIAQNFLGWVYLFQQDVADALTAFTRACELDDNPETIVAIGYLHAVVGQTSEAHRCIAKLQSLSPQRYLSPINPALVYAALGDRDQAFAFLSSACDEHSQWLSEIHADPAFDSLRWSDVRLDALIQRMSIHSSQGHDSAFG